MEADWPRFVADTKKEFLVDKVALLDRFLLAGHLLKLSPGGIANERNFDARGWF